MTNAPLFIALFMYDLAGGGVERMRLRLAAELAARGHRVIVIVQHNAGPLRNSIPGGVEILALDVKGFAATIWALSRIMLKLKPDVLISSLGHCNIAALCAGVLCWGSIPVVICQHNALTAERALGWRYRALPWLYSCLAPFAAGIVAVSQGVANDLAAATCIPRNRITVISNPVADNHPERADGAPPHPWLAQQDYPVFVFAGRLVAQKDPALLLAAFALRRQSGPAKLILLGDGPMLAELRQSAISLGIADDVFFAGFVAAISAWLPYAAALVLSSRYEGFGNVLVEALACGTPVVAADCPHGPAEILAGGEFGRLVAPGDAGALADAMRGHLRHRFPSAALRARAAEFTVAACADRHEQLVNRLLRLRRKVFGVRFSRLTAGKAAALIAVQPAGENLRLVVTPNIDHLQLLRRPAFAAAYQHAALVFPDGAPVALYAWLRGALDLRRVTGCDILHALLRHPALPARRVMVVAESAATATSLRQYARQNYPASQWQAVLAPPQLGADAAGQAALAEEITRFRPDILILTLGAPASEEFVHLNRAALPPCWALCFGQAMRVELGAVQRVPAVLGTLGLEWAWRMLQEPMRLAPRYVRAAAWLPHAIARDLRQT